MPSEVEKALYIVATPIGNLADITSRAVEVLRSVDVIAAEDTRHSKRLLEHLQINTRCIALHEHNEGQQSETLLQRIQQGESIAVISDAGTPLISDPGYRLVHLAQQAGIKVVPIPGACALITALSAAGLPTDKFIFEGFLPAKANSRLKHCQNLAKESRTLVFYESPHRIVDSISNMLEAFGPDRQVVIARELTKTFETIHSANLADMLEWLTADTNQQRGEFVVVIHGAQANAELDPEAERITSLLANELPAKQAAKLAAEITGLKKNQLYNWIVS